VFPLAGAAIDVRRNRVGCRGKVVQRWRAMEPLEDTRRQARLGSAAIRPAPIPPRWIPLIWLFATAAGMARPIARRLPWGTWSRRRRLLTSIGAETLFRVFVADALVRWSARQTIRRAEIEQLLREELGRPPWPEELERAWMEDR
jgi:hypothetical protein